MLVLVCGKRRSTFLESGNVLPLVPLLALAALDGYAAVWVDRRAMSETVTQLQFTLMQPVWSSLVMACWFYIGKLLWPVGLSPIYPRWRLDHVTAVDCLYPAGVLALFDRAVVPAQQLSPRRLCHRCCVLRCDAFAGSRPDSVHLFSVFFRGDQIFKYLAKPGHHHTDSGRWRTSPGDLPILLPVLCGWPCGLPSVGGARRRTDVRHSWVYTDVESLPGATLARDPDSWAGHAIFLGWCFTSQGKNAEAIDHFNKALQGNPRYCPGTLQPRLCAGFAGETHRSDPTV